MEEEAKKKCSYCNNEFPLSSFGKDKKKKDGLNYRCKSCNINLYNIYKLNNKEKRSETNKKCKIKHKDSYSAKAKIYGKTAVGVYCHLLKRKDRRPVIISKEKFIIWYDSQPRVCSYCGIPEYLLVANKLFSVARDISRLTIDRIDNDKDYVDGNLVLACHRCNHIKSNFFSMNEMKEIAEKYIKNKWKI